MLEARPNSTATADEATAAIVALGSLPGNVALAAWIAIDDIEPAAGRIAAAAGLLIHTSSSPHECTPEHLSLIASVVIDDARKILAALEAARAALRPAA